MCITTFSVIILLTKCLFDQYHIGYAPAIKLEAGCEKYINYMRNVSETMNPIYLVVALIPCANLWPWLGQQIGADIVNMLCFCPR